MHPLHIRYKSTIHYNFFDGSLRKVASIYNVSKSSLHRWVKSTDTEHLHISKPIRKRKEHCEKIKACIKKTIESNPFVTLRSVVQTVLKSCNVKLSVSTASRLTKTLGFSKKKAFRTIDYKHDPDQVMRFCNSFATSNQCGDIISIDEAGFYIGDNPRYGYSQRGKRLHVQSSKTLRRRKLTLVLAITTQGVHHFAILDSNCNKNSFVSFIKEMPPIPGAKVLMDNISFHHSIEAKDTITSRGMQPLFNLPYSPRLNPVEYAFSYLKSTYRSHCPHHSDDRFDYAGLLAHAVLSLNEVDHYFEKVQCTVDAVRLSGGTNFCGYDM